MPYKNFLPVCFFLLSSIGNLCIAQEPKLVLPIGHTGEISAAHFSRDGKKVVTVSADGSAKIWDAGTGTLLADLKGHRDLKGRLAKVNFAEFSPDGKKVVTSTSDYKLKIWNAETGKLDTVLKGYKEEIVSAYFSPDGKKIITASADTVKIWNIETWKIEAVLIGHTDDIVSAEFSPASPEDLIGGKKILTASQDSTAKIWDANTNTLIATLQGHSSGLKFAHFSSDGKKIVTVSSSKTDTVKTKKIWNAETGELIIDLKNDPSEVWSAYFSPSGKKIIMGSQDMTAKIWDIETGNHIFYEHEDAVISARYSPDGKKILTVSDLTAKIWDVVSGKSDTVLFTHDASVKSAEFSPDSKKIITASADHTAKIWDAETGKLIADLKGHTSAVKFAGYSPDGKRIIMVSSDSAARLWDAISGKFIAHLDGVNYSSIRFRNDSKKIVTASYDNTVKIWDAEIGNTASYDNTVKIWDAETGMLDTVLTGNEASVNSAVFSPDSTKIMIASVDKKSNVKVWDFQKPQLVPLFGHTAEVNSVEFSHDGKKIVTASSDKNAIIWDSFSGKPDTFLSGHVAAVKSAKFSPDSKKIVTASLDNTIRIWDTATGTFDSIIINKPNGVQSASFSGDGKKILTVNVTYVAVWNAATRELITELKANNTHFVAARFGPDPAGEKIVTISDDVTAKIWDANGMVDNLLIGHDAVINSVEFSPDGKRIITASDDNTVKIWDVKTGQVLYTFFAVDSIDYLVIDKDNRYDGTSAARELLYFTDGTQIISLSQVKDPLWMPGLAERINKGDTIKATSLEDLDVFGENVIPEIEITNDPEDEYKFSITPGRDGIGEIILSVNKIEVKRYTKEQLIKNNGLYELTIKKDSLNNYFAEGREKDPLNKYLITGRENSISLLAKTEDSLVSSEEPAFSFVIDSSESAIKPNLFALIVGTSQYTKEAKRPNQFIADSIDLAYPAKDARAISQAVKMAATKMLNPDHVFVYTLATDSGDGLKPTKQNIKLMLDSIGKKATVNDVLLIFLSGHGVYDELGDRKQFYYLTADAVTLNDDKKYPIVGISTETLLGWIRLENIAASQRILILDACNSGGAIYDAAKNFEKMNDISGLFILAASTRRQSALEIKEYEHGFLTYSLLRVIKQSSSKLEGGKYLNVVGWFNEAQKIVPTLAKNESDGQTPQIYITTADFNIGEIDHLLIENIKLKNLKPLFVNSRFTFNNSVSHQDSLDFGDKVDSVFDKIAKDKDPEINYDPNSRSPGKHTLYGTYTILGNEIIIEQIRIKRGLETKVFVQTVRGKTDDLPALAKNIAEMAVKWAIENNKN